jgi:HrpA-like RNA helicase
VLLVYVCSDRERLAAARKQLNAPAPAETEEPRGQAILVFLPGIQAISSVSRALRKRPELADRDKFIVFELHGTMAPEHQRKVFIRPRPGQWKIVLSTNIAETSITVEDVTHVIDSGLVREMRYDPTTNMSALQEVGISCASAAQRAGRAGRVQEGHCWRCYTTLHHDTRMPAFPDPEIRRIALEEVVLQVRLLDLGPPGEFLRNSPESPDPAQIGASIENLIQIGALEPTPDLPLTALGTLGHCCICSPPSPASSRGF